jgi:hypothetical protein
VRQTTAKSRLARALVAVKEWCRANRHLPILDQHKRLSEKLLGHYAYYAITGSGNALDGLSNSLSVAHGVRRATKHRSSAAE